MTAVLGPPSALRWWIAMSPGRNSAQWSREHDSQHSNWPLPACSRKQPIVDGAPHRALPQAPVRAPLSRRCALSPLEMSFGTDEIGFNVASSRFGGEMRHFNRFLELLKEIIDARI